ncbi:MAG: PAS domain-containing protein [Phycisphaeraceae bacterium]|nr:PAS domain-containing protein [Phycisphaeraceae bacterium]
MPDADQTQPKQRRAISRWIYPFLVWMMVGVLLCFIPITYLGVKRLEAIGEKRDQAVSLLRARRALILAIVRAAEREPERPLSQATASMIESMLDDIARLGESEDGQATVMDDVRIRLRQATEAPRGTILEATIPALDELYVRDQEIVDAYRLQFARIGIQGPYSLLLLEGLAVIGLAGAAWIVTAEFRRRDRVESELRQSRERLADAERLAKLGHWQVDWVSKRVDFSDALHGILGIPREYFGNMLDEAFTVIHPEDRDRVRESISELSENPRPLFDQFRFIVDGETRVMFIRGTPVLDDQKRLVRVWGTAQDITDQVEAEHEIRRGEDRFRAISDYAPLVVFQCRPDGAKTYISPRWEQVTGQRTEHAIGWGWSELIHPDDKKRVIDSWREALETAAPWVHEYRIVRTDGKVRWLHVLASPILDEQREVTSYVGTAEDFTERRNAQRAALASQARFDAVIRASKQVLYDWDPESDSIDIEGGAEDVLGLSADVLRSLGGWTDRIHPDDLESFNEQIARVKATREPFNLEYRMKRADGTYIHVHDRGYFVQASDDKLHMIGLVADVSERKSLEIQFHQAQKMESIGRLAGGIAHDFNNWLTAIIGHARIARDAAIKPEVMASLDQILLAADSAADLTRQLVAFARKQIIEPKVCRPADVVDRARTLIEPLIGEGITLEVRASHDLLNFRVDPAQIQQVLVNLVINARDAMPDGGSITIELANTQVDAALARQLEGMQPGQYVQIAVTDRGSGIPSDNIPRIFEPFFTTKEQGKGTGLGLPTVMGIMQQSGGHIKVESEVGSGTTFRLYFPAAKGSARADTDQSRQAGSTRTQAVADDAAPSETILLVEDQPLVRDLVREVLERRKYTVLLAGDAAEAMAVSDTHKGQIHLLLTDLVLPGMNGRDLAAEIERRRPGIRVLLSSGYTDRLAEIEPGLCFIQKPYSPDALAAAVRHAIDSPAATASSRA